MRKRRLVDSTICQHNISAKVKRKPPSEIDKRNQFTVSETFALSWSHQTADQFEID